jgi:hypothetical protein
MSKTTYRLQQEDYIAIVTVEDGEVIEFNGREIDRESCEAHALWKWEVEQEYEKEIEAFYAIQARRDYFEGY